MLPSRRRRTDAGVQDRVDALASMDDVKYLDVHVDRLRRWHVDGLLCIGDAAHAMSPVGGVGINLAVRDAVAAATRRAGPLQRGTVTPADLAAVRRRRILSTRRSPNPAAADAPRLDRADHRGTADRAAGACAGPRAPCSQVSIVPAYLIGVGLRPEQAPDFARRPAKKDAD
jgi:2-polyprenyl-6-methoxyphenol hydroxylase-like FAD-dependent oxidoreductase